PPFSGKFFRYNRRAFSAGLRSQPKTASPTVSTGIVVYFWVTAARLWKLQNMLCLLLQVSLPDMENAASTDQSLISQKIMGLTDNIPLI
ncbi:MAG: hypothetical protein SPL30_01585, partial [Succinivibrio sp.]|nr:hypothetical protein [Succinivibrio sp.]